MTQMETAPSLLTPATLLEHWQGHRRLTRRTIEAFPEDQLFTFSIGGMRTFGELAGEMLSTAAYNLNGLHTDDWSWNGASRGHRPTGRGELLSAWDALTVQIDAELPGVSVTFLNAEKDMAWARMTPLNALLYQIDNEVHHRGQGYVYLRSLGTEPPAFYER